MKQKERFDEKPKQEHNNRRIDDFHTAMITSY